MYALEHLDEIIFFEKVDYFNEQIQNTLERILDEWIAEGIITEKDKENAIEDWENDRADMFTSLLG